MSIPTPDGRLAVPVRSLDPAAAAAAEKAEEQAAEEEAREEEAVEQAAKLAPKLLYEVIRRDGEEELTRPTRSLVYSGFAAGMMISMSVLGEAIFRTYLPPDASWSYLVENLGYALGFLVVILGRMQLFTENTITTVLPVVGDRRGRLLVPMLRLWAIVLSANVVGAFAIAAFYRFTPAIPTELWPAITSLSLHATGFDPATGFARAIPAGILVAALVWMMPQRGTALPIILIFTWLIAAGDFTHVVAGSVEWAWLVWGGETGFVEGLLRFFLPVLAGNIVGGTAIFTLLAYGQVKDEVERRTL